MSDLLTQEVVDLANRNLPVMVRNFAKIGDWLKNGSQSQHPLPPAILAHLERVAAIEEEAKQAIGKADNLAGIVDNLVGIVDAQKAQIGSLIARIEELEAAKTAEPTKRTRKKAEPKAEVAEVVVAEPVKDEVQLTAEAVGAGELTAVELDELDKMIDGLQAPSAPADMEDF